MTNHPPSEELFAYRDGELDREKRGLIEAHVLSCTACRARLEDMSDVEGALRQQHAGQEDSYFDAMTRSVMARVAPGAAGAAAPKVEATAAEMAAGAGSEPARDRLHSAGRRRNRDDEPRSRAPRLPWPAILSAASAAVAVLVVVVILFRSPQAWLHAPRPEVVGLRKEATAPAPAPGNIEQPAPPQAPTPTEPLPAKERPAPNEPAPAAEGGIAAKRESKSVAAGGDVSLRDAASLRANESDKAQGAPEAVPDLALQKDAERLKAATAPPSAREEASGESRPRAALPSGSEELGFAPLAARLGLPPLFDPNKVSHETLLRAEPEIRLLYQTGKSGADSARVRLYLAEAARLRAGDSPDAETFDAIVHHYRRAVELARDPATYRMAKKRMEDFVSRTAPPR
jgi:hypothetical protein